jgi:tRNA threonylcarbamoyl adenosine modification protein YeaZ
MLAINTAFMTANLGLKTADGSVVLRDIDAKSKHSENVLKTIDEMCEQANVNVLDVGTVAVVVGPGSFTGLRIGTAIGKALGCVNPKLKFLALSSLELMAYVVKKKALASGNFVCAINALSNLFFVAYFDKNGIKLKDEQMIDFAEFEKINLPKFCLAGDIKGLGCEEIMLECGDFLDFALQEEEKGKFAQEKELVPVYLRLSQAEDMLAKKQKKD